MWEKTSAWAAKPHSIYHLFFSGANHYESRCKRFTWLPLGWLNWASVMAWDHSASVSESNCIHHDALESGVTLKFNYVIKGRWIGTEPDAAVWCACLKSKIYNGTGEVRCSVAEVQFRTSVQTWTFPNRTNTLVLQVKKFPNWTQSSVHVSHGISVFTLYLSLFGTF